MINTDNTTASAASAASTGATSQSNAQASQNSFNTDFQSFLSLLTAQLRNQDPLSPLDSTQFVEQLASFSGLEQQIETNSLLEEMVNASSVSELETATQWIGKEVDAPGGQLNFLGEPVELKIPSNPQGEPNEFVMRNATTGAIVYQGALSEGQSSLVFDGKRADGSTLPNGRYEVAVNYINSDGDISSKDPIMSAKVNEARLIDGSMKLILDNGAAIEPDNIQAVREVIAQTPNTPSQASNEGGDTGESVTASGDDAAEDDTQQEG